MTGNLPRCGLAATAAGASHSGLLGGPAASTGGAGASGESATIDMYFDRGEVLVLGRP